MAWPQRDAILTWSQSGTSNGLLPDFNPFRGIDHIWRIWSLLRVVNSRHFLQALDGVKNATGAVTAVPHDFKFR